MSSFLKNQIRQWHWISSAITLFGMLIFSFTGLTLNHPDWFKNEAKITSWEKEISRHLFDKIIINKDRLPAPIIKDIGEEFGVSLADAKQEKNGNELYFAMPGPGVDEWLSIDLIDGVATYERSHRGVISVLNDLHKGRDTGIEWKIFIDVIAIASIIFCLTGFGLLLIYEKGRKITWPMTGLGLIIPILLFLLFVHT